MMPKDTCITAAFHHILSTLATCHHPDPLKASVCIVFTFPFESGVAAVPPAIGDREDGTKHSSPDATLN